MIQVMDLYGRVITSKTQLSNPGRNIVRLDASTEAAGVYIIMLQAGETRVQKRLVVAK